MTQSKWLIGLACSLSMLSISSQSLANQRCCPQECADESGFILGLQAGYVDSHWDDINYTAFGCFQVIADCTNSAGVRPYVGYAFNRLLALEFGYTYLGEVDFTRWSETTLKNRRLGCTENWAVDLSLRASIPLSDCAGLLARVGGAYVISDDSFQWRTLCSLKFDQGDPDRLRVANFNVTFGFGAYFNFTPELRGELSWTRFEGNSEATDHYQPSPDFFSVGFSYRFPAGIFS